MTRLVVNFRLAARALRRNTLRTALTMLGMIIGVGAVVTMAALGNGAERTVEQEVRSAGTNLVNVRAGNYTRGGEDSNIPSGLGAATTLSVADLDAIRRDVRGVKRAAATVRLRAWVAEVRETAVSGTNQIPKRFYGQVAGTDVEWPAILASSTGSFARGRFFNDREVASRASVAVLGAAVAERLFGASANVVGRTVAMRDRRFTIVGLWQMSDEDQSETVFVPYTALQDLLGISYLHGITVEVAQSGDGSRVASDIAGLLRRRHRASIEAASAAVARFRQGGILGNQMPRPGAPPGGRGAAGPPDDFTVKTQAAEALTKGLYTSVAAFVLANMPKLDEINMQEMASTLQRAGATMTALLAGMAAISLIVGGIGIMNIMLVSVTERTREIGLRRAVGARARDVRMQFLVEAVTLALAGGAVGLVAGWISSGLLTWALEWPTAISASSIALALAVAAAVGVFFGFYPAERASKLTPIDALRHE
jgi:ABC-type antimicrobial peptide transport system permease subunit